MRFTITAVLSSALVFSEFASAGAQIRAAGQPTLTLMPNAAPGNVTAALSAQGAHVSWAAVQGATLYQLLRGPDSVNVSPWGAPGTTTSVIDGSVGPGSLVFYRVAALYANGSSAVSAATPYHQAGSVAMGAVPTASSGVGLVTLKQPNRAPPSGVTVSPLGIVVARITWPAVTGATHYEITRTDAAGASTNRGPAGYTQAYFTDTVPDPRQTYAYRVTVHFPDNGYGQSAPVSFAPPPLSNPGWMRASTVAGAPTSIDLAWETRTGAIGYWVRGPGLAGGSAVVPGGGVRALGLGHGVHSWSVIAVYPSNAMDTTSARGTSAIVRVLPSRSSLFLTKPAGAGDYGTAVTHSNAFCGGNQPACNAQSLDQYLGALGATRWPDASATYANVFDLGRAFRRTWCQSFQVSPPFKQSFQRTVCFTEHSRANCWSAPSGRYASGCSTSAQPISMIVVDPAGAQFLAFTPANEKGGCDDVWCWQGFRQTLVAQPALDAEGNKYMPFACMSCHGGVYDPQTGLVRGATLLPIDPSLVTALTGEGWRDERARQLNAIVYHGNSSPAVRRYISGLYGGQVDVSGAQAVKDYVPHSWQQQNRNFYLDVLRKNCVSCHLAGPPHLDFTTSTNFFGNAALVHKSVCVDRTMPHAEVPFKRFWTEDTGNIYVPGLVAALLGFKSC